MNLPEVKKPSVAADDWHTPAWWHDAAATPLIFLIAAS